MHKILHRLIFIKIQIMIYKIEIDGLKMAKEKKSYLMETRMVVEVQNWLGKVHSSDGRGIPVILYSVNP